MRALANGCTAASAGDPTKVIEVAAEGAYVVGRMMGIVGDHELVISLSRALGICL